MDAFIYSAAIWVNTVFELHHAYPMDGGWCNCKWIRLKKKVLKFQFDRIRLKRTTFCPIVCLYLFYITDALWWEKHWYVLFAIFVSELFSHSFYPSNIPGQTIRWFGASKSGSNFCSFQLSCLRFMFLEHRTLKTFHRQKQPRGNEKRKARKRERETEEKLMKIVLEQKQ